MLGIISKRIGVRIALLVNVILSLFIALSFVVIYYIQTRNFETEFHARGKLASIMGAKGISRIMEEAIENGALTLDDIMDTNHIEIPGYDPPKYHTRYDAYMDKASLSYIDEALRVQDVLYATFHDTVGYLPTHNTKYQKKITGIREKDIKGNRTKRIFNDEYAVNAVKNKVPGFMQVYHRDTGETVWDISSPIYVKGNHWGAFRMGFSLETIEKAKYNLLVSLLITMVCVILLSVVLTFYLINRALNPLSKFTQIALELADGNVDVEIESTSRDEIGKLADVLERLRISLKAAMSRLKRR